ncbi:MAG: nucleotide pyrophosphohydrolase [Solobacterium sp.]|nr:nucleotide pyrophosphohydrolase [Solobacterium sp.]
MIKDETIERIRRFSVDRDWGQFHSPVNLAKSISIEAGELLECFQWSDTEFDRTHVMEEVADVMNYCLQMCDAIGADPDEIINRKCDQNEAKYPVEKAKGKADKYTEL